MSWPSWVPKTTNPHSRPSRAFQFKNRGSVHTGVHGTGARKCMQNSIRWRGHAEGGRGHEEGDRGHHQDGTLEGAEVRAAAFASVCIPLRNKSWGEKWRRKAPSGGVCPFPGGFSRGVREPALLRTRGSPRWGTVRRGSGRRIPKLAGGSIVVSADRVGGTSAVWWCSREGVVLHGAAVGPSRVQSL
jgi:hypothetical protein